MPAAALCDFFQASKSTVGSKASEIERTQRLRQHSEPGLCRPEFMDSFTNIMLPDEFVVSLQMAKQMGMVPPDARVG